MLYKQNTEKKLSNEFFKNPTSEYRGAPFWAWNCDLKEDVLGRQIDALKEMGFGGFQMHSRSGMSLPYLVEIANGYILLTEEGCTPFGKKFSIKGLIFSCKDKQTNVKWS